MTTSVIGRHARWCGNPGWATTSTFFIIPGGSAHRTYELRPFLLADLCFVKKYNVKKSKKNRYLQSQLCQTCAEFMLLGLLFIFRHNSRLAACPDFSARALAGSVPKALRPIGYRITQKTDHGQKGLSYLTHSCRPGRETGSEFSAHTIRGRYFRASISMIINYLSLGEFINRGERFRTVWQTGLLRTSFAQVSDHLPCLVHYTRTTDSPLEYCKFPHPSRLPPNSYAK